MTKRTYLHFSSTMVKTTSAKERNEKIISANGRRERETSTTAKHHLTLCCTQNIRLQDNTITLHYYSPSSLDTAFSHKGTPWTHQGSLPDFTDTPPKLNGLSVNHPPNKSVLKSHALELSLPQSSSWPSPGKRTPHSHEDLHLNTHLI